MLVKQLIIALVTASVMVTGAQAVSAPVVLISPTIEVKKPTVSRTDLDLMIDKYANQYNVSGELMKKIIMCESGGNPLAVGDHGHSRGLVQIFDDYHPTVTHEMAFDPEFSIEFLAKHLALGKGNLWTCYYK